MPMPLQEFMGRCNFYTRNGKLYGVCTMRLRNGMFYTVETRPEHGIPLSMLTTKIAMSRTGGQVSGLFDDVWSKAKSAATGVAKKAVSKDLLSKASALAKSDLGSAVLTVVPYGPQAAQAVKLGSQAADLLSKASAGHPEAKAKIAAVVAKADAGSPVAKQAKAILQAVHAKGKAKGVFPSKNGHKTTVQPGGPSKTAARALAVAPVSAASTPRRFAPSRGFGFSPLWSGLPGLVRSMQGSSSVGHWSQWQFD